MTENSEKPQAGVVALNRRLFRELPLFLRLLPLSVIAILLSSAAPSLFRWYSGNFSNGSVPLWIPGLSFHLSFTLNGMILLTALATLLRISAWALFEMSGMWSAQVIHRRMVRAMTLTRTTFFDENHSSKLINRLIRDFDEVRSTAIIFVGDFFNATIEVLSIAVIAALAHPWAGLLLLPLLFGFFYIQYQRSGMLDHARALSAVATGEVIGRKTDLIEGRSIFLLYGRSKQLLERMEKSYRRYVQAMALAAQVEAWASFWMRVTAETFSFIILLIVILALARHRLDSALAGVIISSLFGITGSIGWLDFATGLVSRSAPHLRRVFEFVDLPTEELEERKETPSLRGRSRSQLTAAAVSRGDLIFDNYSMSYRKETPVILESLNLVIPVGQKVALIGRTGSGKTSLMQSLLRMVYVHQGDIRIGEQSIFELEVRELRKLFGVVPQAPYLFAGTIRSNLDRSGMLSAEQLERSLGVVGLDYRLDDRVSEGGQNLSVGERQLVCLARVIAAQRQMILMDEPTSGLDPETDARVSQIFRSAFKDKTVLTIAHRRESLGNYDRIIEMSQGRVVSTTCLAKAD